MNQALTLDELKQIELEILKQFHEFCEAHNLRYVLAYGTLLGAVRHKGFIPWDDDIDVMMPRPDYETFVSLTMNGFGNHVKTVCHQNDAKYPYPFAKVIDTNTRLIETLIVPNRSLGVYIDIFPIDGAIDPSSPEFASFDKRLKRSWLLVQMASMKLNKGKSMARTIIKYLTVPFARLIGPRHFIQKQTKLLTSFPYETSAFAHSAAIADLEEKPLPRDAYEGRILAPFESEMFYIPEQYDLLLRASYSDYMTLPPKEQQTTVHTFTAYRIQ